jgi:hypothetical protein
MPGTVAGLHLSKAEGSFPAPKTRTPGWFARLNPCSFICGERLVQPSPRILLTKIGSTPSPLHHQRETFQFLL